ncbi:RrF2 family transcriptional regulator [Sulfurimonas sp.]
MELSNTTQYAIRILNYINSNSTSRLYTAKILSEKLSINYKFLTTIMTKLVKAEFLESVRGKDGGFKLKKDSQKIVIMDIIELFDDSYQKDACLLGIDKKCNETKKCFMHDKWVKPKKEVYELFESTTLEDVKDRGESF